MEVLSLGLVGLEARAVRLRAKTCDSSGPLVLLGLPEAQARETRVRVRAALQQLGIETPDRGVVVTIEPANLALGGAGDLAMAVAILVALGHVPGEGIENLAVIGELSLTGAVRPVRGVLPSLLGAAKLGIRQVILPSANGPEAANVTGLRLLVADHLRQVVEHLRDGKLLASLEPALERSPIVVPDLVEPRGLEPVQRALEIAAAGEHPLLLVGPPGPSKTTLARRLSRLLPPMSREEELEVTSLCSVAGLLSPLAGLIQSRPFRVPHFTVSAAGLLGGGEPSRPGEVSLAHHGVLFLDELHEHRRSNLEALGRVLDEGHATICRARQRVTFPAKTLLVGAIHACPCGFMGTPRCTCSPAEIAAYQDRLTGPLFDRFDLRLVLPPVDVAQLQGQGREEPSSAVQRRVQEARSRQLERAGKVNAQLSSKELSKFAAFDLSGVGLSELEHRRVLRVARTVADLDASDEIRAPHAAEALQLAAWAQESRLAGT